MAMAKCSYPDCSAEFGLTSTDLGLLCGLHLGAAQDIIRSEQRLINAEARIAELEAQLAALTWTPISESNLPKVGDEVYSHLLNETRCVTESFLQMHGADPRVWNQYGGWTHFRPINPPSPERGANG